jgi:hypothetical protein
MELVQMVDFYFPNYRSLRVHKLQLSFHYKMLGVGETILIQQIILRTPCKVASQ